jgi:ATP phosphoribosyltransferase
MAASQLRLAVPSKGRLREGTLALLKDAGLQFEAAERALSVAVRNADLELLFIRTDDIPELVQDGVADVGICGQDLIAEFGADAPELAQLGFGRCRLMAAVPNASPIKEMGDLQGLRVATAHRNVTARFFEREELKVGVIPLKGSVEVAPKLGVADGIVDLVSSGSTLRVNGLRTIGTLLESEAVLFTSPAALAANTAACHQLATALLAVVNARQKRYLLLNAPAASVDAVTAIIPGLASPTIVPEASSEWVAVHSVVDRDAVWDLLPRLQAVGARDILVMRIEQMVS